MRYIWNRWKAVTKKIGDFQATVLFSIFYFVVVTPVGLLASLFRDSLSVRKFPVWKQMEDNVSTLKKMELQ